MRYIYLFFLLLVLSKSNAQDSAYYLFTPISLNTTRAEMTPLIHKLGILYARSSDIDNKEKQRFLDIYYAKGDTTEFLKASPIKGKINEAYNEAAVTFVGRKKLFFTRNSVYKGKKKTTKAGVLKLDIFEAYLDDKGEWTKIKPFSLNNKEYSVGHPAWSAKEKRLYFASDMPGGYGGTDLYYTKWDGKEWVEPRNLGKSINSEKNEMFPTIGPDQSLYFASDREGGAGGLDLYSLYRDSITMEWDPSPKPLWGGFNSPDDDFGITFYADMTTGYITSNKAGGMGSDDIYYFKLIVPPPKRIFNPFVNFELTVFDQASGQPIPFVKVHYVNQTLNQTFTFETDSIGQLIARLDTNNVYNIELVKAGFFNKKVENLKVTSLSARIGMTKMEVEKSYEVSNIYYDLNSAVIRPDAAENLGELIQILLDNPVKIELGSHTDVRGSAKSNLELSQARAKSAVEYIVSKGIDPERLIAKGYGATMIVNKCKAGVECTEEEHEKNRRTEFKILEISK